MEENIEDRDHRNSRKMTWREHREQKRMPPDRDAKGRNRPSKALVTVMLGVGQGLLSMTKEKLDSEVLVPRRKHGLPKVTLTNLTDDDAMLADLVYIYNFEEQNMALHNRALGAEQRRIKLGRPLPDFPSDGKKLLDLPLPMDLKEALDVLGITVNETDEFDDMDGGFDEEQVIDPAASDPDMDPRVAEDDEAQLEALLADSPEGVSDGNGEAEPEEDIDETS